MKIRFIGNYSGGRDAITMGQPNTGEFTFYGRDPTDVDLSTDTGRRLFFNPDFECVSSDGKPHIDQHLLARAKANVEACKAELMRRNWEGDDLAAKKAAVAAAENRLGVLAGPLDHDGDGEPGGSVPKKTRKKVAQ